MVDMANEARSAELAVIISYPTSRSGIIVLLKTPTQYGEFFPTIFVKTTFFTRTVTSPELFESLNEGFLSSFRKQIGHVHLKVAANLNQLVNGRPF